MEGESAFMRGSVTSTVHSAILNVPPAVEKFDELSLPRSDKVNNSLSAAFLSELSKRRPMYRNDTNTHPFFTKLNS